MGLQLAVLLQRKSDHTPYLLLPPNPPQNSRFYCHHYRCNNRYHCRCNDRCNSCCCSHASSMLGGQSTSYVECHGGLTAHGAQNSVGAQPASPNKLGVHESRPMAHMSLALPHGRRSPVQGHVGILACPQYPFAPSIVPLGAGRGDSPDGCSREGSQGCGGTVTGGCPPHGHVLMATPSWPHPHGHA